MTPATLRLLEVLLDCGAEGGHRETLMLRSSLSTATFYRALEPLLAMGVVSEQRGHYTLPLSHPYNFAYKLWNDQAKILALPTRWKEEILAVVSQTQKAYGSNLLALWVHGSAVQNTMGDSSDLDVLAVLRKDQDIEVTGWRPVQLTILTDKYFREDYRHGDNFIHAVLAHGILAFDRQFAAEFYARPFPKPVPGYRQNNQQKIKNRLYSFVREEALDEAQQTLSSFAVMIGRSLLEQLDIVPAGKPDMLKYLDLLLGPTFSELFRKCLAREATLDEIYPLQQELQSLQHRFELNASFFKEIIQELSASANQFENACREMLRALYPTSIDATNIDADSGLDMLVQQGGQYLGFWFKSYKSEITRGHLRKISNHRPLTLIINQYREIPLVERPPISSKLIDEANILGITLEDSRELLRRFILKTIVRAYYYSAPDAPGEPIEDLDVFFAQNSLEWQCPLSQSPNDGTSRGRLEVQFGSSYKPGYYRFTKPERPLVNLK